MDYQLKLQYDHTEIADRATKYKEKRESNGRTGEEEDRRMEEAGWRLVNGPFDINDVRIIVEWKSRRRMDLFKLNRDGDVETAIKAAIAATRDGDVRRALKALMKLKGVGLKMASAILTAMFPTLYTVCDFRASHALGQKDYSSLRYYVEYLDYCQRTAAQYGVSLRDFDRANWQWSREHSPKKGRKQCPKPSGHVIVGPLLRQSFAA